MKGHAPSACPPHAARRAAFARRMGPSAVAVLAAAPLVRRNGDVDYDYRQDSDFHYLTGFEEPGAVLLISPRHPKHRFVLFVRPRDPAQEVWVGPRAGIAGARRRFGADAAFPIDQLEQALPQYLSGSERLFHRVGRDAVFDEKIIGVLNRMRAQQRSGTMAPSALLDPATILGEMRLHKGPEELAHLRKAIAVTAEGHLAAMALTRPGRREFEVQADLEHAFRSGGSPRVGYGSIVGGGANGTILHYTRNADRLKAGDLLLIDAGAEIGYYTADVTRTFPVSGRFSPEQRALYDIVLEAQEEGIRRVRPGASFQAAHDAAVEVLTEGCRRLGLLKGSLKRLIKTGAYRTYYMHRTSHWLGMDVHDAGRYRDGKKWRRLAPGMVLTVEPGLYVSPDCRRAPAKYRGIGIRIEDDVLVTKGGCEVLSRDIPKAPEAVEALMGRGV